jgi:hypothetical protein
MVNLLALVSRPAAWTVHRTIQGIACAAIVLLTVLPSAVPIRAQATGPMAFVEGEELVYNVRYTFINLGQVRIKTVSRTNLDGHQSVFTRAFIDSYKGVPFVDLHAVFESAIDTACFSRYFMGKVKQDAVWDFSRYHFEYDRNRVIMERGQQDTVVSKMDTTDINGPYQDGLSLFFYARSLLFSGKAVVVPTLIKEQKSATHIDFGSTSTSAEIDAVDYPIDVVHFDGKMDFVGIFGLTGGFEGWFSNDNARVPILAKMKVLIGSVTIELMEWKRPGWNPPKAKG